MRTVIFSAQFDKCVEELGGYRALDVVLDPVVDGLGRNPWSFEKFETDHFSFRWARTKKRGDIPPLFVIFEINEDRTITLQRVEIISS